MYVIDAEFRPLWKIPVGEVAGERGVLVLWTCNAWEKPSTIAEGSILERLNRIMGDDNKPFSKRTDGYVCLFNEGPEKQRKSDSEVVKHTLLVAAEELGLRPLHYGAPAKMSAVHARGAAHDRIRINFRGWHPLRWDTKLRQTARLTWVWQVTDDGMDWVLEEMPWRRG